MSILKRIKMDNIYKQVVKDLSATGLEKGDIYFKSDIKHRTHEFTISREEHNIEKYLHVCQAYSPDTDIDVKILNHDEIIGGVIIPKETPTKQAAHIICTYFKEWIG